MTNNKKNKRGRKSKYYTHVEPKLDLIEDWRQKGDTEEQISNKLGISYKSLNEYKLKFPQFTQVLRASKERLAINLKKSLWKEALGYEYEEVKKTEEKSYLGNKTKTEKTKKKFRGQPNLLIFALCNLLPDEFKRIDKEIIKELEDKIDEKLEYNNDIFKKEFEKLFPKKNIKTDKETGKK